MKLYHITKDLNHNGLFYPRIPQCRAEVEDSTTPRICFSASIEGALTALPVPSGKSFSELNESFGCVWKVFEVEIDILPTNALVTPKELYEQGKVLDAWLTEEYWITQELDLSKSAYYILIDEFEADEVGEEEQEAQLDCLGWSIHENNLFKDGVYKRYISLEGDSMVIGPNSFEDAPVIANLRFYDTALAEDKTMNLKAFCNKEAGLEYDEQESIHEDYMIKIENNEALQKLCRYIGTEWVKWKPLN